MSRVPAALLATSLVCLVGGCGRAGADSMSEAEARMEARGIEVYQEQHCGTCHTLKRAGTAGVFGPDHDGIGARAETRIHDPNYRGKAKTAADYIRESVRDPTAYRVPGYEHTRFNMPAFTNISDEDLNALVFMLSRERERD
jgi:mono/diheme cytochrome c family protein